MLFLKWPITFYYAETIPGMIKFENLQIQLVDTRQSSWIMWNPVLQPPSKCRCPSPRGGPHRRSIFQMEILLEVLKEMRIRVGRREPLLLGVGWAYLKAILLANKCDFKNTMETYGGLKPNTKRPSCPAHLCQRGNECRGVEKGGLPVLASFGLYKGPGGNPIFRCPLFSRGKHGRGCGLSIHKDFLKKLRYARIWALGNSMDRWSAGLPTQRGRCHRAAYLIPFRGSVRS